MLIHANWSKKKSMRKTKIETVKATSTRVQVLDMWLAGWVTHTDWPNAYWICFISQEEKKAAHQQAPTKRSRSNRHGLPYTGVLIALDQIGCGNVRWPGNIEREQYKEKNLLQRAVLQQSLNLPVLSSNE